ncbi:aquaporin [Kyrpidia tusciae]|uniref:aquaporin n=1 Tax=Kyrpidia tusciae TaxID=33943 RepID=UPI000694131D|nr:aquaporin [Kyrpidia tusciae]
MVRRLPWREVPACLAAQLIGAAIGALGIVVILGTDGAIVGNLGATVFAPTTGYVQGIVIEAIEVSVLMTVIMGAAVDGRAPQGFAGMIIG